MKLEQKIEINIFDFFKYGKFDYIKLGHTKEWIINNFPDPDDFTANDLFEKRCNIWRYGDIEFHFTGNTLSLIYSDKLGVEFNGGESLIIDKWILNTPNLKLIKALEILNENDINYEKKEEWGGINLKLESGVKLLFHNFAEIDELNKNDYELFAFGLEVLKY